MADLRVAELLAAARGEREAGRFARAEGLYREALKIAGEAGGEDAGALVEVGGFYREMGKIRTAIELLRRAIAEIERVGFGPAEGVARIWFLLSDCLRESGDWEAAMGALRKVLELDGGLAAARRNLGLALVWRGDGAGALAEFERLVEEEPAVAERWEERALAWVVLGENGRAIEDLNRALLIEPGRWTALNRRAQVRLLMGDIPGAWGDFEYRRVDIARHPRSVEGKFGKPKWDGSELGGKIILLHAEKGVGDTIFGLRWVGEAAKRGGRVWVYVQEEIAELCERMEGVERVIRPRERILGEEFEVQLSVMSLPGVLGVTLDRIGGKVPYLAAEAGRVEKWRGVLGEEKGIRVGVVWAANAKASNGFVRTLGVDVLAGLVEAREGVRWVSLQKGEAAGVLKTDSRLGHVLDLGDALLDYSDTAAVMSCLDWVATVDTSVAHLAGAMGIEGVVMLPAAADWRWFLGRGDSPWYPSLKLVRQEKMGEWGMVVEEVRNEVGERVRHGKRGE